VRLVTIFLFLALLAVPAALSTGHRSVTAPAPVLAVTVDGSRIAYAVGRSANDCNRVYVWSDGTHAVTKLGRATHCEQTSTGNAIASLALAGTRALWLHYVGGNFRTWSLWTATTSKPGPLRLRSIETEADAPAPILVGRAHDDVLPYAVGRNVIAMRANGARRYAYEAEADVADLAADGSRLAVATRGGIVTVLDGTGAAAQREVFTREIDVVRLSGTMLVVQMGRTLDVRGPFIRRTWTLPARAQLEDVATAKNVSQTKAVYVVGGQVRRLVLATGAQSQLGLGTMAGADSTRVAIANGRVVTLTAIR
jgi:hypothetical protein